MPQRISFIGLSTVLACAPASAPDGATPTSEPATSSSASPVLERAPASAAASGDSSSAPPDVLAPSVPLETVQAPPSEIAPPAEPVASDTTPFEAGLDEILDARPIRLTKRTPEVLTREAERLALTAKGLPRRTKGKGKAHADAAVVYEELAYALRRELAKTPATAELAAELRTRKKAAEDLALEHYFEGIAEDNSLDEAKYRSAHLLHARGNVVSARKQYFILVENHPNSRFVPLAYLAFALLFADDARSDPAKWPLVEASAQQALEPKGNPGTPEALFLIARAQRGAGRATEFAETASKLRREFPKSAAAKRKL